MINIKLNPPGDGQLAMFFDGNGRFVCAGRVKYGVREIGCEVSPYNTIDIALKKRAIEWFFNITHWKIIEEDEIDED